MTIASRLEEIRTAKQNIKEAIQSELGADLTSVAFVDYYKHIKCSGGGFYAPSLNISYAEQEEYVVGTEVTFNGVTKTLDGSTVLTGVPITYNGSVVATSGSDGSWSYSTVWVSGGCEFSVVDDTYGVVCRENVYPNEKFYDSFTNLQTRVNSLAEGDTLTLDCNYRYLDSTENGDGVIISTSNITIDGQGKYILDGNSLSRIITNNDVPGVSLKGLTFKNGKRTNDRGGAIRNYGSDMSISDCTFTENTSKYGGAISNDGSDSIVDNSTFVNNFASDNGGAIANQRNTVSITNCILIENTALTYGNVAWCRTSSILNISDCYWGTNNPTFDDSLIYNVTVNTYLTLEITTETISRIKYIKVQAKQYNPSTSTTSTTKTHTGEVKATITVGDQTYMNTFRNGILRQAYTAPTAPYDITVQLESGEVITKTIEA